MVWPSRLKVREPEAGGVVPGRGDLAAHVAGQLLAVAGWTVGGDAGGRGAGEFHAPILPDDPRVPNWFLKCRQRTLIDSRPLGGLLQPVEGFQDPVVVLR